MVRFIRSFFRWITGVVEPEVENNQETPTIHMPEEGENTVRRQNAELTTEETVNDNSNPTCIQIPKAIQPQSHDKEDSAMDVEYDPTPKKNEDEIDCKPSAPTSMVSSDNSDNLNGFPRKLNGFPRQLSTNLKVSPPHNIDVGFSFMEESDDSDDGWLSQRTRSKRRSAQIPTQKPKKTTPPVESFEKNPDGRQFFLQLKKLKSDVSEDDYLSEGIWDSCPILMGKVIDGIVDDMRVLKNRDQKMAKKKVPVDSLENNPDGRQLFLRLKKLKSDVSEHDYLSEGIWDIDGIVDDMRVLKNRDPKMAKKKVMVIELSSSEDEETPLANLVPKKRKRTVQTKIKRKKRKPQSSEP